MKTVTRDEFFRLLYADTRDIMPTTKYPDRTTWETKSGFVWGVTYPGWKNPNADKRYEVTA